MLRLIVSEKPSMGHAIARALNIHKSGQGFIQNNEVIITWCIGHLVEALAPEDYNLSLKQWRMDSIPFFPDVFKYAPIESTKKQYDIVTSLMNREDVSEIINATDAGREGELIFDLVYQLSGTNKPVLRFWTSSLTEKAIKEAYQKMKPSEAYKGLRDAARCRQEADWLVGINCTRAQTLAQRKIGGAGVYSVGRVQTPTLALIVNRDIEIKSFIPKDFWTLSATFLSQNGSYKGKWFNQKEGKENDRFSHKQEAQEMANMLNGQPGKVISLKSSIEKKRPELLYDLTTLQKEANKRFGFTADHTLKIAQTLYEAKLISYPRTSSRHLTNADALMIPNWIKAISQGQFQNLHQFVVDLRKRWPVRLDKRFVSDKDVDDHTAIVPTENPAMGLSSDQASIYELIARRLLAAHWPNRLEAKTIITTKVVTETFNTIGTIVKALGWTEVDPPHRRNKIDSQINKDEENEESQELEKNGNLPKIDNNEKVETSELCVKLGKTSPPKRMTEGDLLGAMQSAGKELSDEAIKGALKDCGLGTPATRASIIETLIKRDFIKRNRNVLQSTPKGVELISSIQVESLKSPQLTGEWEAQMECIRRGDIMRDSFMRDIHKFVKDVVSQIKMTANKNKYHLNSKTNSCPKCGAKLLYSHDENGNYYAQCSASDQTSSCSVFYQINSNHSPLEFCQYCSGPIQTTNKGIKRCAICNKWTNDLNLNFIELDTCSSCGKTMCIIPSTTAGDYFQRCSKCGVLKPM